MFVYISVILCFSWFIIVKPEKGDDVLGGVVTGRTNTTGKPSSWDTSDPRSWKRILKQEKIEHFNVGQWRRYEPIIPSLPVENFRKINITDIELIRYLGGLQLKPEQLSTLAETVKTFRGPSVLRRKNEILNLGNIFCGYSVNDLAQLNPSLLRFLLRQRFFENLNGCSPKHLKLLAEKVQSYTVIGPSRTWEPDVVELAGSLVAGLDEEQLRRIRSRCVGRITPRIMEMIPTDNLKKMRNEQLLTLSKPSLLAWRRKTQDLREVYSGATQCFSFKILIITFISMFKMILN